jgi:PhnB protein
MPGKVQPIPEGYRGAMPYLCVKGAARAIEFYKEAFGAKEMMRFPHPDGRIGHAEIRIGDAVIMLADEFPEMAGKFPEMSFRNPQSLGGTPVHIFIYVNDVDALTKQAIAAGAKVVRPVADQFYGDRLAVLEDPFGHSWSFATHIEDVPPEEIERRAAQHHGS